MWNEGFVRDLAEGHISGRGNFLQEINAVLTLDAIERCFFTPAVKEEARVPVFAGEDSRAA
jgi:hypothetical protein